MSDRYGYYGGYVTGVDTGREAPRSEHLARLRGLGLTDDGGRWDHDGITRHLTRRPSERPPQCEPLPPLPPDLGTSADPAVMRVLAEEQAVIRAARERRQRTTGRTPRLDSLPPLRRLEV